MMRLYLLRKSNPIVLLLVFLALSSGLTYGYWLYQSLQYVSVPLYEPVQTLTSMHEPGVQVALTLERDRNGMLVLASTFTPDDPTSHLYSMNLPRTGIEGIGRPTLLEIPLQSGVRTIGPVSADRPVLLRQTEGFRTAFPIY